MIHINGSHCRHKPSNSNAGDKIVCKPVIAYMCASVLQGTPLQHPSVFWKGCWSLCWHFTLEVDHRTHTHTHYCTVRGSTLKLAPQHHCMASWVFGICVFLFLLFVFAISSAFFSLEVWLSFLSLSWVMTMITAGLSLKQMCFHSLWLGSVLLQFHSVNPHCLIFKIQDVQGKFSSCHTSPMHCSTELYYNVHF